MSKRVYQKKSLEGRFWSKVDIKSKDECWTWKAFIHPDGYGKFCLNGKMIGAHRMAYILTHGEIEDGLVVMHTCDIKPCCNPYHLMILES
jgi:hypothetical protein